MFEIQTQFTYGWENVHVNEEDEPIVFDTLEDAQQELRTHLQSMLDAGMDFSYDDYRIIEI